MSRICSGYARLFVLSDAHYNPHLFAYIYLKKVWLPKIFDVLELVTSDSEIHVSDIESQGALIYRNISRKDVFLHNVILIARYHSGCTIYTAEIIREISLAMA